MFIAAACVAVVARQRTYTHTTIKTSLWTSIDWQQYVTASICFSALNDSISKQQFMCIFIVSLVYNEHHLSIPKHHHDEWAPNDVDACVCVGPFDVHIWPFIHPNE